MEQWKTGLLLVLLLSFAIAEPPPYSPSDEFDINSISSYLDDDSPSVGSGSSKAFNSYDFGKSSDGSETSYKGFSGFSPSKGGLSSGASSYSFGSSFHGGNSDKGFGGGSSSGTPLSAFHGSQPYSSEEEHRYHPSGSFGGPTSTTLEDFPSPASSSGFRGSGSQGGFGSASFGSQAPAYSGFSSSSSSNGAFPSSSSSNGVYGSHRDSGSGHVNFGGGFNSPSQSSYEGPLQINNQFEGPSPGRFGPGAGASRDTYREEPSFGRPSGNYGGSGNYKGSSSFSSGGPSYSGGGLGFSSGNPTYGQEGPSYSKGGPSYSSGGPSYSSGGPSYSSGGSSYSSGGPSYSSGGPNYSSGGPSYNSGGPFRGGPPSHSNHHYSVDKPGGPSYSSYKGSSYGSKPSYISYKGGKRYRRYPSKSAYAPVGYRPSSRRPSYNSKSPPSSGSGFLGLF